MEVRDVSELKQGEIITVYGSHGSEQYCLLSDPYQNEGNQWCVDAHLVEEMEHRRVILFLATYGITDRTRWIEK